MIEVTPELIDRYAQLMSEHAGYAVSRNTERILQDLVKQAEITERSASSIPVTLKMTVIMTEEGELKLALDDVSWKVMSRSKDDDFYTVPLDDKQMELPGLERNPPPKPVVDVKALPEHESPVKRLLYGRMYLADNFKHNLQKSSDTLGMMVAMPASNDRKVLTYDNYVWNEIDVPNVEESLKVMDDGEHIVFGIDGIMTDETRRRLVYEGYAIMSVRMSEDGKWEQWKTGTTGVFELKQTFIDTDNDRRQFAESLVGQTEIDECLLASQAEMCNLP